MRYRWSYSEDGGTVWTEVSPTNGSRLSITQARDLSAGQVFFRKKLAQAVILGSTDYRAIDAIRRNPARRCETLLLRCEAMCGSWSEYWRGEFSAGSAKWDLDNCTVEIKAETVDRYSCLLGKAKQKFNILQVGPQDNITKLLPAVDFLVCSGGAACAHENGWCDEIGGDPEDPLNSGGWEFISDTADTIGGIASTVYLYWRERTTTICIEGAPVPPPSGTWTLYSDDCATSGTAQYVRPTVGAYPFGTPIQGTFDGDGNPVPPDSTCSWYYVGNVCAFGSTTVFAPYFICLTAPSDADTALDRGRRMDEVVEFLLESMGCSTTSIVSDLFEWSPVGDAPGYAVGFNYVTGTPNQHSNLLIHQKTDVIGGGGSNPATIGELTFEELMRFFRVAYRAFWFIDDSDRLRIEHWSYFTGFADLDLTTLGNLVEPLSFESLGAEIPALERATWMEALGRDFVGLDIVYTGPCVNALLDATEWQAGRFSTDVAYVSDVNADIAKDGFVVLACTLLGSVYHTILDYGAITDNLTSNAPLSWANLQRDFWTWDRPRPSGTMNGTFTDFDGFLPTVKQGEVSFDACCSLLDLDPRRPVVGGLSARIAVAGSVESLSHDLYTDRITMAPQYPY